jgi:hypothetical protein
MIAQSAAVTRETLIALERFLSSNAELPGRKLIFFISDGFAMDPSDADIRSRLQRVADTAARSGSVIYTIDARGLGTQPSYEAIRPAVIDDTRSVDRANADELSASQDPLYKIAVDTGGRMIANTNALTSAIPRGYNAKRAGRSAPDVLIKTEVFREGRRIIATPSAQLKTTGISDLSRIPYFAALNLEGMSSGKYVLQLTATDRAAGTTVSQRVDFAIE